MRDSASLIERRLPPFLLPCMLVFVLVVFPSCRRPLPEFGPSPHDDAEVVLAKTRERQLAPESLIGDARVRIAGPFGRGSADHFVVVRAPANLRLETLSFFGNPMVLVLVSDGDFLLWEIEANRAWEGPATQESLAMLLPIELGPEEIVGLLRGMPLLFEDEKRLELDHENRRYVVSLREGASWQQLMVHPNEYTVEQALWFDAEGEVRAALHYDRFREVSNGRVFPHEIRYETADGVSLRVLYRDISFEPDPPQLDRLFEVALPDHVPVAPLETGARMQPVMPDLEDS